MIFNQQRIMTILAKKHWPYLFMAFLLLLNFILKIIFLDSRDIAMDEPFTIFYAQADLKEIFTMLPGENNPPLFFLLLHFWIKIFGISAFSVRFLPFVFSCLTALMVFQTGRRFFSMKMGMAAALIFTFSNYQLLFAHEARVYSLFALLTSCSMYLFMLLRRQPGSRRIMLLLSGVNILLLYSHFFGFLVIGIQIIAMLSISQYRAKVFKSFMIALGVTLLAYIPYFPVLISRYSSSAVSGTWVSPPVISDLYTMLWRYSNAPVATVFMIGVLGIAALLWLFRLVKGQNQTSPDSKVLLIWFLIPYLAMFLISFIMPVFLDRYTVFISIGYYLLVALALDSLPEKNRIFTAVSAMAILLMAVTFSPDLDNKRRLKEATGRIESLKGPGTAVIICPSWLEYGFAYHHQQDIFRDYRNLRKRLNACGIYPVNGLDELDSNLLNKASSVIFFEEWATLVDKKNRILSSLSGTFPFRKEEKVYENFNIHLFSKKPIP